VELSDVVAADEFHRTASVQLAADGFCGATLADFRIVAQRQRNSGTGEECILCRTVTGFVRGKIDLRRNVRPRNRLR
jgi:hypothetical protein